MIKKKYVPFKTTSMYELIKKYKNKTLPFNATWTNLETHGQRPYLSEGGLLSLVEETKNSTDGGLALSLANIRDMVKKN